MAGQGAGPSRRSHTKSRTGCKTCKRRHIRCDETFPQCRNCTKHQVRCDYMDQQRPEAEMQSPPDQMPLPSSPGIEHMLDVWQQTGNFPYPELQVFPPPGPQNHSRIELRLIQHLSSISRSLLMNSTSDITVWTSMVPKYLSVATSYSYVMHAFLAFSASHLAWVSPSPDTRKIQIQHGGIALRGLHDAISSFSKSNADAILATSILLMTQANDWRTWSSLETGIRTVASAMAGWKHESVFADLINLSPYKPSEDPRPLPSPQERHGILTSVLAALQRLQPVLAVNSPEAYWIEQLLGYISYLLNTQPAQTAAEQFDQLYSLRKWVLFVPCLLLEKPMVDGPSTLVVAHLYATALALEPLFPSLGASFCAAISLPPLERIIQMTAPMQTDDQFGHHALEISSLMHFPQQAVSTYRARLSWTQQHLEQLRLQHTPQQSPYTPVFNLDGVSTPFMNFGNLSPGFVPSSINHGREEHRMSSDPLVGSPYLGVPTRTPSYDGGFSDGTSQWGTAHSPAFPPNHYAGSEQGQGYNSYDFEQLEAPHGGFRGGFVVPPTIWA
ncbi:hypothetical protein M436DRAFT_39323 [Aureobasidium namibiae CBS 147.97]|uniref:Zn(2)-C6 fungal-type domain-containing protein n=1 Tax=Aureobasidium namibiae CBS 147.97 TaxID=1043004 RepID=A0A074WWJ2_9PEZI|nr:uncharacterized protein M436DRAFT_39323 [Aureobasidium namibiae CBS 147.97]KEQ75909.1 hypothetical protein M436DRAFT_39323 [Aureobasidium namibiae CBS 147.97]